MSIADPPPPQQPLYSAPPKKGGGGRGLWLLGGCLVLLVGCVVVAGGGFLLNRSGLITEKSVLNLVGRGPVDIQVDNFRDDTIGVTIQQFGGVPDASYNRASFYVNPFGIRAYHVQDPSLRYRVDFSSTAGTADLGTCNLTLKPGDQYQFVALPDKIVVNRANQPSSAGPDFVVGTSALCR